MQRQISPLWLVTAGVVLLGYFTAADGPQFLLSVTTELLWVLPLVLIVAGLAGWMAASDFSQRLLWRLTESPVRGVMIASVLGAVTPVCGLAAVPLVAALLRQGVPLAAAMAFWLASPVTDPGMLLLTASFLGWPFAIGKLAAAAGLGVAAGFITHLACAGASHHALLRHTSQACVGSGEDACSHRTVFLTEAWATMQLVTRWLVFALALESLLRTHVDPAWLAGLLGGETIWAVPLAVVIASPMYIEGYAAMPVLRGLMDLGLSPGAAMAFLFAGSTISIYSAAAVWSVAVPRVFALYLAIGISGAIAVGYLTQIVASG